MAAKLVELADTVANYVDGYTSYPFTFNTRRVNVVTQDLADTFSTSVAISPGNKALGADIDGNTREGILKSYQVRLHILNFLEGGYQEENDALLLMEALEDSLIYQDMGEFAFLDFSSDANPEPPFDIELQNNATFFYSLIQVNYLGT